MTFFEFPELFITQIILVVIGVFWLLKRNDEIPLLISSFLLYCGSYRYWAVTTGLSRGWVRLSNFGFSPINEQKALIALSFITFGEFCLLGFYILFQRQYLPAWNIGATPFPLSPKWSQRICGQVDFSSA